MLDTGTGVVEKQINLREHMYTTTTTTTTVDIWSVLFSWSTELFSWENGDNSCQKIVKF